MKHLDLSSDTAVLMLALLGLIAYANVTGYPFVHDDFPLVVNNSMVAGPWNFKAVFLHSLDFGAPTDLVRSYYRPVLDVINHAVFSLFGANAAAFHLWNVFLHILNGWMVFRIVETISFQIRTDAAAARWHAFIVAALFVVHPVQTQAAACVSGISNLVFAFFCLAAFLFYLSLRQSSRPSAPMAGMTAMFVLALLSKEQALIFPGLILLYEGSLAIVLPECKIRLVRVSASIAALVAVTALYLIFRIFVVGAEPFTVDPTAGGFSRFAAMGHILLINAGLLVWPADLHYFRSLDLLSSHWAANMMSGVIALGLLGCLKFLPPAGRFLMIFGGGWFLISQLTTIQIIPLFWEYSHMSLAEHFLYFPSIGMFLMGLGLVTGIVRRRNVIFTSTVIALLAVLIAATIRQNTAWASELALFQRSARFEGHLGRVQQALGDAHLQRQEYVRGIAAHIKAVEIMNRYETIAVGEKAKSYYRALGFVSVMAIATAYLTLGDWPSAVAWLRRAVALDPDHPDVHENLGIAYAESGDAPNARIHLAKAVELAPDRVDYRRNLELFLAKQ